MPPSNDHAHSEALNPDRENQAPSASSGDQELDLPKDQMQTCPLCMEASPSSASLCAYCLFPLTKALRSELAASRRTKLLIPTETQRLPLRFDFWIYGLVAIFCPLILIVSIQLETWRNGAAILSGLVILTALGRWLTERSKGRDLRGRGYRLSFLIGFGLLIVGTIAAQ